MTATASEGARRAEVAQAVARLEAGAKRVEFERQNHIYTCQKRIIPSVTTIIKSETDVYGDYDFIDPEILQKAADRGHAVHEAIERSIKEKEPAWTDYPSATQYVDGYNAFMELGVLTPLLSEIKLPHPDEWYAGTIDIVGLVNGEFSIVDAKTTSKLNKPAVRLQLAGYAKMVHWWTGLWPKRFILHLGRNSRRNFVEISDRDDRIFARAVRDYNERNKR